MISTSSISSSNEIHIVGMCFQARIQTTATFALANLEKFENRGNVVKNRGNIR